MPADTRRAATIASVRDVDGVSELTIPRALSADLRSSPMLVMSTKVNDGSFDFEHTRHFLLLCVGARDHLGIKLKCYFTQKRFSPAHLRKGATTPM